MNLFEVAAGTNPRLSSVVLRGADGRRAAFGGAEKLQFDPPWRDHLLFHEYFQADTGAGLGASHQTGWTGIVAKLIQMFGATAGPAGAVQPATLPARAPLATPGAARRKQALPVKKRATK